MGCFGTLLSVFLSTCQAYCFDEHGAENALPYSFFVSLGNLLLAPLFPWQIPPSSECFVGIPLLNKNETTL